MENLQKTFDKISNKINQLNRIEFNYGAVDEAPKFDLIVEQEHNYYMRCPICGKASEFKSRIILDRFECKFCEAEFTIGGQMLFDGQSKHYYQF